MRRGPNPTALAFSGILAVALAVRLHRIDSRPPDNDEKGIIEAVQGKRPLAAHRQPPLAFLLEGPAVEWTGRVGGLRVPPLLCGLALVAAGFALARRLAGSRAGLWAAAVLAVSPVHVGFSQYLKAYEAAALGTLLAVHLHLHARDDPRRRRWHWLWPVAGLLAVWSHYLAVFPVAASAFELIRTASSGRLRRRALLASLVLCGACLPLLPWVVSTLSSPGAGAHPDEPRFAFAALAPWACWLPRAPEIWVDAVEDARASFVVWIGVAGCLVAGSLVWIRTVRRAGQDSALGHLARTALFSAVGIVAAMIALAPGSPFAFALVQPLLVVLAAVGSGRPVRGLLCASGLAVALGTLLQPWPGVAARIEAATLSRVVAGETPVVLGLERIWHPPVLAALESGALDVRRPPGATDYVGWVVSVKGRPLYLWDRRNDLGGPGRDAALPARFRFVGSCDRPAPAGCGGCRAGVFDCAR